MAANKLSHMSADRVVRCFIFFSFSDSISHLYFPEKVCLDNDTEFLLHAWAELETLVDIYLEDRNVSY